jgi:Double zinc ribbon
MDSAVVLIVILCWAIFAVVGLMIARARGLRDIDGIAAGLILGFIGWLLLAIWPVKQSAGQRQPPAGTRVPGWPGVTTHAAGTGTAVQAWPGVPAAEAGHGSCPACGAPITPGGRFCPTCGRDLATRRCARCGGALQPWAQFCQGCGAAAPTI